MEQLIQFGSWGVSALQVPVAMAILYLLARSLMEAGRVYGQGKSRLRWRSKVGVDIRGGLHIVQVGTMVKALVVSTPSPSLLRQAVIALQQAPLDTIWHQHVITQFELNAQNQLALFGTMMRIGPLLGLMGALIPLEPALAGLAMGDMDMLAGKMEVAFTTIILGLAVGAIGFFLYQVSSRWALDDLSLLQYLSRKLRDSLQGGNDE